MYTVRYFKGIIQVNKDRDLKLKFDKATYKNLENLGIREKFIK